MRLLAIVAVGCAEPPVYGDDTREESMVHFAAAQRWSGPELTYPAFSTVEQAFPGPGVGIGDLDGDGDLDLFVGFGAAYSLGFRNDGTGTFLLDPTITADGGGLPGAQSVALADIDGDDDLDVFLGTASGDLLLHNAGDATFTAEALPDGDFTTTTGSFGDFDGDGDLDIVAARHIWPIDMVAMQRGTALPEGNTLYVNQGDHFTNEPGRLPAEGRDRFSLQAAPADLDADGDLDLYVLTDVGPRGVTNVVLENDGDGTFTVAEGTGLDVTLPAHGASFGDVDGDGVGDVFTSNVGPAKLYLGDGDGGFADLTGRFGLNAGSDTEPETGWGHVLSDLDGDGWNDAAVVHGKVFVDEGYGSDEYFLAQYGDDPLEQGDRLWTNEAGKRFYDVAEESGFDQRWISRAVASGDLDRDGRPDLVTAGFEDLDLSPYVQVFLADGGWGKGVTVGFAGEATPIGARVEARADGRTIVRWLLPSTTFSSSAPEVYIGLRGDAATTAFTVFWPDGERGEFSPPIAGDHLVVSRVP